MQAFGACSEDFRWKTLGAQADLYLMGFTHSQVARFSSQKLTSPLACPTSRILPYNRRIKELTICRSIVEVTGSTHSEGIALVMHCLMGLQTSKLPYLSGKRQATNCCTLLVGWLSSPQHARLPAEMQQHRSKVRYLNARYKRPNRIIDCQTPAECPDRQAEKTMPDVRQAPSNGKGKTQLAATCTRRCMLQYRQAGTHTLGSCPESALFAAGVIVSARQA